MAHLQTLHQLLEADAQANSSAVFVYDTTTTDAFGATLKSEHDAQARVYQMQTRPGAGASLVGFVESVAFSSRGASPAAIEAEEATAVKVPAKRSSSRTSSAADKRTKTEAVVNKPVTVLASTASLLALTPSLLSLPSQDVRPPVTIHVSAQTSSLSAADSDDHATLTQVPDLASLTSAINVLSDGGWEGAIVLSETASEAAEIGTGLSKSLARANIDLINVFDGQVAGREYSRLVPSTNSSQGRTALSIVNDFVPSFVYHGSTRATDVIVVPASAYSIGARAALSRLVSTEALGVLVVRVATPWTNEALVSALPPNAKTLHLLLPADASSRESAFFYENVLTAVMTVAPFKFALKTISVPTNAVPSVQDWQSTITSIAGSSPAPTQKDLLAENAKLAIFWDLDYTTSSTQEVPLKLARTFGEAKTGVDVRLIQKYDNYSQGGIQQSAMLLEPAEQAETGARFGLSALEQLAKPSILFLSSPQAVLKSYNPFSKESLGTDTRVVLATNWTPDDLTTKLPAPSKQALAGAFTGNSNLFVIDIEGVAAKHRVQASEVQEIVFWSFYLPSNVCAKEIVTILGRTPSFSIWEIQKLAEVSSAVRNAIAAVTVPASWADEEMAVDGEKKPVELPVELVANGPGPNPYRTFAEPIAKLDGAAGKSWHKIAQRLMYPESFAVESQFEKKLRPDLPEKTFLVEVSENRRLTPTDYPRNVFHMELSTKGTGLKYAVGEAVGVHGWNDEEEVLDFIKWYGLDPDAVISVPAREDPDNRVEQRTVFQTFQQNLDLFGKPGKSFYETLSRYATNKNEERHLRFIAAPEGVATFKKMSEVDTVTYADVLRLFPSAKPSIEDLVREIEPIKPRHYSIASSQNFVGDSIHLLVVTVEWETPKGSPRFGQCTRYLAGLKPGAKVMVSVRPSVMKLPPKTTDPIIMAGLGTGAAPFRAFIQERAWQRAQGLPIGPALYYFGSRHRSKEYLYGEEIEAYLSSGVVTHTGLAFSRDGAKKVYIQHKMHDDADLIRESLEQGTFYLCGPTEPYGDVNDALIKAHIKGGRTPEEAESYISSLKDEERLVLELY